MVLVHLYPILLPLRLPVCRGPRSENQWGLCIILFKSKVKHDSMRDLSNL